MRAAVIFIVLFLLFPISAHAATTCSFPGTGTMSFTAYDVFSGAPTYSNGSITVKCTKKNTPVTFSLDSGANSATVNPRAMKYGADYLSYYIYSDSGYTTLFGNGSNGGTTFAATTGAANTNYSITLYGEITAGQDVGVGPYSDTINVTINF